MAVKRAFPNFSSKMEIMEIKFRGETPYLEIRQCPFYQALRGFYAFSYENA